MTIATRMQLARLKQAALYPGQGVWRVYVGGAELLNPDDSTPYIKQLSVNEAMAVSALSGVVEDVAFWMVRHLGEAQSVNQNWALSLDNGESGFLVQCVRREVVTAATEFTAPVYEYFLKGNVGGAGFTVPKVPTAIALSIVGASSRVVGDPAPVILSWSVTPGSYEVTSITVAGISIPVVAGTQSGTVTLDPVLNAATNYTLTVIDSNTTTETSVTVSRRVQFYWGRWDGVGAFTSADLNALDGAGDGPGRATYSGSNTRTYDMSGERQYFVWVYPLGESLVFSTAFGPLTDNVRVFEGQLENQFGWPEDVQVWRSRSPQAGRAIPITVAAS